MVLTLPTAVKYNWDLRDWCRGGCKCRGWRKRSRGKFCSEYVALQLGLEDPDLMTPKDLAENPDIPYKDIQGPISKEVFSVLKQDSSYKFKF